MDKQLMQRRLTVGRILSCWAIAVLIVPICLAGCVPSLHLQMDVKAQLPGGSPQYRPPHQGAPLAIRFDLSPLKKQGTKCGQEFSLVNPSELALNELRYSFLDDSGNVFFSDSFPLVGQSGPGTLIVHPGLTTPDFAAAIRLKAELDYDSITFDDNCQRVIMAETLRADLNISLDTLPADRYQRIRTAYMRRHLLTMGRGLSWVWLKEYEPQRDRKELLYHSRVFRTSNDAPTRVFIPWIYNCSDLDARQDANGDPLPPCGSSIHAYADSVYGGSENPLLRGGLAMAVFSIEARHWLSNVELPTTLRDSLVNQNLSAALGLLSYVEASEWVDPSTVQPTGFFLRARWPGDVDKYTKKEYLHASMDEIMGVVLGLSQLHKTLEVVGHHDGLYRVRTLTNRLASRLQDNHYLLLPYRRATRTVRVTSNGRTLVEQEVPIWQSIGLPDERHKGWYGGFAFEWFLSRAFASITGNSYPVAPLNKKYLNVSVEIPFLSLVEQYADQIRAQFGLPHAFPIAQIIAIIGEERLFDFIIQIIDISALSLAVSTELELFSDVVEVAVPRIREKDQITWGGQLGFIRLFKQDLPSIERAVAAIQGIGILNYYDGQRYPLCERLLFHDELKCTFVGLNLWKFLQIFGEDHDPSTFIVGPMIDAEQYNLAMLQHAFVAADPHGEGVDERRIRSEMAKLMRGVLSNGAVQTAVEVDKLIPEEDLIIGYPDPGQIDLPDKVYEYVGRPDLEGNLYGAVIAKEYDLASEIEDPTERNALIAGINFTLENVDTRFFGSAPAGTPKTCSSDQSRICDKNSPCPQDLGTCQHWPMIVDPTVLSDRPIGSAFVWEYKVGNRTQGGGVMGGLKKDNISTLYRRGQAETGDRFVAIKEGAGLGYLLPYAMSDRPLPGHSIANKYLPGCFPVPAIVARDPATISPSDRCTSWFSSYNTDRFDTKACQGGPRDGDSCRTNFDCGEGFSCTGNRNDAPSMAARLSFGLNKDLTTDKSSSDEYWENFAFFKPDNGQISYIPPETDYDFYFIENPEVNDIEVTVKYLLPSKGFFKRVYLDGVQGTHSNPQPCPTDEPCMREVYVSAPGRVRHNVLIFGDIGPYEVQVNWRAQ